MASKTGGLALRKPNRLTRVVVGSGAPSAGAAASGGGGGGGSSGGGGSGDGGDTPFGRTPTFLRPLEDDEHASVQELVKGVVQIFASTVGNDWSRPWSKANPSSCTGTGFIISAAKRLIITNAHCTTDAQTLQV